MLCTNPIPYCKYFENDRNLTLFEDLLPSPCRRRLLGLYQGCLFAFSISISLRLAQVLNSKKNLTFRFWGAHLSVGITLSIFVICSRADPGRIPKDNLFHPLHRRYSFDHMLYFEKTCSTCQIER